MVEIEGGCPISDWFCQKSQELKDWWNSVRKEKENGLCEGWVLV